jgi:hypothetical protein
MNMAERSNQALLSNQSPLSNSSNPGNEKALHMDLNLKVQGFMARKQERLTRELAEKYDVPLNEVDDIVDSFLKDTYGPAQRLAESIHDKELVLLLFIGKKGCTICQKSRPILESFLSSHPDLEGVLLDYSQSEGLLYHMIHEEEKGMLPLIAFIFHGTIRMISYGECISTSVYENYYSELHATCSQNIYVH